MNSISMTVFSLLILGIVFYHAFSHYEIRSYQYRVFIGMIASCAFLLVFDGFGAYFADREGLFASFIQNTSIIIKYALTPMPIIFFSLYTNYLLFHNDSRVRKLIAPACVLFLSNLLLMGAALLITGGDIPALYQPGLSLALHVTLCCAVLSYGYTLLILNRKRLPSKTYHSLLIFALPPVAGNLLYLIITSKTITSYTLTLSVLILYLNIQYSSSNTDYLTGLYNRRHFDDYLRKKIKNCSEERIFGIILLDINCFKGINDEHGHELGDRALKEAAGILRRSLRFDDFIARIGGDEFAAIVDVSNMENLKATVLRIKKTAEEFNLASCRPYQIRFSIGYDLFDPARNITCNEYLKRLDNLMYMDKSKTKLKSGIVKNKDKASQYFRFDDVVSNK